MKSSRGPSECSGVTPKKKSRGTQYEQTLPCSLKRNYEKLTSPFNVFWESKGKTTNLGR